MESCGVDDRWLLLPSLGPGFATEIAYYYLIELCLAGHATRSQGAHFTLDILGGDASANGASPLLRRENPTPPMARPVRECVSQATPQRAQKAPATATAANDDDAAETTDDDPMRYLPRAAAAGGAAAAAAAARAGSPSSTTKLLPAAVNGP
ncbi:hypothetical protein Purlil1_3958 [Purpureocillium lilacinum]|uniref:Uncharacterized protein n=1 Tax=Purpureocillium lilacinum TaxID=33203 RepID=A0ABR0C559_PURLI|nr:hypothetical protein Purlil1_3958 [Purpureocillium lilacinum]